jgi:2'-5' RNA ligase
MSYVLTLRLDDASFAAFDALRRRHFPPERNFLPAHLTLFHQLPEDDDAAVRPVLATAAAATPAFPLEFTGPRSLGRGVAFDVRSDALRRLRRQLADAFEPWLTRQDAQGFRPHVTVQNKASAESARQLLAALATSSPPANANANPNAEADADSDAEGYGGGSGGGRGSGGGDGRTGTGGGPSAEIVPPRTGRAEGLLLWRYAGGPWDAVDAYPFRDAVKE